MNEQRKYALTAGISLMVMAVVAGFSYGYVYSSLVVAGADTTIQNISASISLFIGGIIGWVFILILDVIAALALYQFFKPTNYSVSLITGMLRLLYTAILGVAIMQMIGVVVSINSHQDASGALNSLHSFESFWSFGLIIFGLHLIGLGILTKNYPHMHIVFSWLLLIAGLCYLGIHLSKVILLNMSAQIQQAEMILSLPMALGELAFALWLVIKGGK